MTDFPRTTVGGISLPRLICGSNWMLGFSHTSAAKDRFIKELFATPAKVAEVIEVFARNGCNAFMSMESDFVRQALDEVEQRAGREMLWIVTPHWRSYSGDWNTPGTLDDWKRTCETVKTLRGQFCFPHQCTTDGLLDRRERRLMPELVDLLRITREFGLVPGLSTHTPESVVCADNTGDDVVEAYIQPYNAAGFLCQVETDWISRVIRDAKKPVMTIKPLAAGRLLPPTGLAFVWNTIRDCDMVTIGTMSPYEAEEVIELSRAQLEQRSADVQLQYTRSKASLKT